MTLHSRRDRTRQVIFSAGASALAIVGASLVAIAQPSPGNSPGNSPGSQPPQNPSPTQGQPQPRGPSTAPPPSQGPTQQPGSAPQPNPNPSPFPDPRNPNPNVPGQPVPGQGDPNQQMNPNDLNNPNNPNLTPAQRDAALRRQAALNRPFTFQSPAAEARFNEGATRLYRMEQRFERSTQENLRRLGELRSLPAERQSQAMHELLRQMLNDQVELQRYLVQSRTLLTGQMEFTDQSQPGTATDPNAPVTQPVQPGTNQPQHMPGQPGTPPTNPPANGTPGSTPTQPPPPR